MSLFERLSAAARELLPDEGGDVAVPDRVSAALSRLVRRALPELEQHTAGPRRARVTGVETEGGQVDELHGRYSITVQPILANGEDDPDQPEIPDLALPVIWGGANGRGIFARPKKGALVRIGYYEGDPAQPYVDAVLADGFTVPSSGVDELVIAQSDGTRIRIAGDGTIVLETSDAKSGAPVRTCDVCAFTGTGHPEGAAKVTVG